MKSTAKDIILLCKGWYNKEKYPTILDALKQYYRKNYCDDMEECLNERLILRILLFEVMREITEKYPDRITSFINRYLITGAMLFFPEENNNDYDYQMFYRIIAYLACLQMRGDGFMEIDTDDYFYEDYDDEDYKHKMLIEEII